VVLAAPPDIESFTSASEERTHVAFGAGHAWSLRVRVLSVRPRGERLEITCVGEADEVHAADWTASPTLVAATGGSFSSLGIGRRVL
jgi:hypothetical protein